jgi:hypothetical protein
MLLKLHRAGAIGAKPCSRADKQSSLGAIILYELQLFLTFSLHQVQHTSTCSAKACTAELFFTKDFS